MTFEICPLILVLLIGWFWECSYCTHKGFNLQSFSPVPLRSFESSQSSHLPCLWLWIEQFRAPRGSLLSEGQSDSRVQRGSDSQWAWALWTLNFIPSLKHYPCCSAQFLALWSQENLILQGHKRPSLPQVTLFTHSHGVSVRSSCTCSVSFIVLKISRQTLTFDLMLSAARDISVFLGPHFQWLIIFT